MKHFWHSLSEDFSRDWNSVRTLAATIWPGLALYGTLSMLSIAAHEFLPRTPGLNVLIAGLKIAPLVWLLFQFALENRILQFGLVAAMLGDLMLAPVIDSFVGGLCFFGLAHVCFAIVLWRDSERPRAGLALPLLLAAAAQALFLPGLSLPMRFGFAVYGSLLTLMAAGAGTRSLIAFSGAVVFALSDSMIAVHAFWFPIPGYWPLVLGTYYAAMLGIVMGYGARTDISR